jgi:hypothetical protein
MKSYILKSCNFSSCPSPIVWDLDPNFKIVNDYVKKL